MNENIHISLNMFTQANTHQASDACKKNWYCLNQVPGKSWDFLAAKIKKCLLNPNKNVAAKSNVLLNLKFG